MSRARDGRAKSVFVVIGTRPEAIKLGPVVQALKRSRSISAAVVSTAQHKEMLQPMLELFEIKPKYSLDLMRPDQTLADLTSRALARLAELLTKERPDFVLVQGDTSTAMAASVAAFYCGVPSGHVEAGLRSGDMRQPFPEEFNRRVVGLTTRLHFAPTERARANLLAEGVAAEQVLVTGNTIVDAVRQLMPAVEDVQLPREIDLRRKLVLVTAHRRENHGAPLQCICRALKQLAKKHPEVQFVYPVHLNPAVNGPVREALAGVKPVILVPPLSYPALLKLMSRAMLIITDSGGIQEEAASLCKPVLILREVTERPEVIEAGFGELVGTDAKKIVSRASAWMEDAARRAGLNGRANPFGDGHAAEKIVSAIELLQKSARATAR